MTDTISLLGLRVHGHHGVLPAERVDGQVFVVDVVLKLDLAPAGASDALADTVDYGTLAAALREDIARDPVDLIETLAQRLADRCLSDPQVQAVQVRVHKPQAPVPVPFEDVVITIRRSRR